MCSSLLSLYFFTQPRNSCHYTEYSGTHIPQFYFSSICGLGTLNRSAERDWKKIYSAFCPTFGKYVSPCTWWKFVLWKLKLCKPYFWCKKCVCVFLFFFFLQTIMWDMHGVECRKYALILQYNDYSSWKIW